MRFALFLLALMVLGATVDAQKSGKMSKCEKQAAKAKEDGTDGPECDEDGNFIRRQCNDKICWCVKKKSGKPAYNELKVPLKVDYACKRKPKPCLRKQLELLVGGATDDDLPDCKRNGAYEAKQCKEINTKKCKSLSRKKRHVSPLIPCGTKTTGFLNLTDTILDTANLWTFVPRDDYVSEDGEVTSIELNVLPGGVGKTIKFGVYEPTPNDCQFTLLEEFVWTSATAGYNVIELSPSERLQVQNGDYLGFTWEDGAVLGYKTDPTQNYCEDCLAFSPGEVVTLVKNRHGNRKYDVRFTVDCKKQWFGDDPIDRANVDAGLEWTFVNKDPFPAAGQIKAIEFYVGRANKPISFGVYREVTSGQFTVERQLDFPDGFPLEFNRVDLSGENIMYVAEDDNFGIAWTDTGVIDYDLSPHTNYFYHTNAKYAEDATTAVMSDIYGKRIYSVRVELCPCALHPRGSAPNALCFECHCVDKEGTEVENSRTKTRDMRDVKCGQKQG